MHVANGHATNKRSGEAAVGGCFDEPFKRESSRDKLQLVFYPLQCARYRWTERVYRVRSPLRFKPRLYAFPSDISKSWKFETRPVSEGWSELP